MAKVIGPLHSSEARGRVGALVYNTWRGISYTKSHVSPTGAPTAAQLAQRALIAAATAAWANLTNSQRAAWDTYADRHPGLDWRGTPVRRSGQNLYISLRVRAVVVGGTPLSIPPDSPEPYPLTSLTLTDQGMDLRVTWSGPTQPSADAYRVQVYIAGPMSAGRQPRRERAIIDDHRSYGSGTYDIPYTLTGRYGIWAYVVDQDTGQHSSPLRALVDAVYVPTGTVFGSLEDEFFAPIPNVSVSCGGRSALSGGTGLFTITLVPAGAQTVVPDPFSWDWSPVSKPVTVTARGSHDVGVFTGTPPP